MFCIKCGSKTNNVRLDGESIFRDVCSSCNYIHYVNPKIIVGVLPFKNNRILLCKRDIHPGFGKWTLPSGFMEMGESLEQGAKREALEEANLEISIKMLYGTYSIPEIGQVLFIYIAKILNEDFKAADETSEVLSSFLKFEIFGLDIRGFFISLDHSLDHPSLFLRFFTTPFL